MSDKVYTFTLPLRILKAANLFASDESTRYYLNGVNICAGEPGFVIVQATDEHKLIRFTVPTEGDLEGMNYIIPSEAIEGIKVDRALPNIEVTLNGSYKFDYYDKSFNGKVIDGTFPDVERVIPKADRETAVNDGIGFNPAYLGKFAKVNQVLGRKGMPIKMQFGDSNQPVLITSSEYVACVMPMRV